MSSNGRPSGNVGSQQSRRPTRERKQAQHFGHSEPTADLEELVSTLQALLHPQTCSSILIVLYLTDVFQIEASGPRTIVHSGNGGATRKPSLWVTLPLPLSILSPTIKSEEMSKVHANSSSKNPKKRTAALADDNEDDVFVQSSSREPAPKRQRARKPTGAPKAKVVVKVEEDGRPEPRGRPEVWAEVLTTSPST